MMVLLIIGSVVLTGMCVLLIANFMGGEKKIRRKVERQYALDDPGFAHELGALLGPAFIGGNRHQLLRNGDEIFPAMLSAIRDARSVICFETYIYWSGDIGRSFADALGERAAQGVKVHVLLDWLGSARMDAALMAGMEADGVVIRRFHAPPWAHMGGGLHWGRINNRTHRKLLIVDGRTAFTGGVGIAPQWTGDAQSPEHWRDSHFKVEGPVVAQIQAVFLDNWVKVTGEVLHGPNYFPPLPGMGAEEAQMFSSSPAGGSDSMQLMYLLAITAASRSIDLSAAYFVPDDLAVHALIAAMQRGVKLRIVVPGEHIDSDTVRSASRRTWGRLLAAGALIAEYQPTMYHCKVLIIDNRLVSVGSTNFDNRSFRLNDEAALNILDHAFAAAQTQAFEADLALATPISYAQWQARPWRERLAERWSSLLSSQL